MRARLCILTVLVALALRATAQQAAEVVLDPTKYTYRLSESVGTMEMWTTPTAHKVTQTQPKPANTAAGIFFSAARGERESFQIVVEQIDPSLGGIMPLRIVTPPSFPTLSVSQKWDIYEGLFDGDGQTLKSLKLLDPAAPVGVQYTTRPTVLWFTVFVPTDAPPGPHQTMISIDNDCDTPTIGVTVYVFDFALPTLPHFAISAYLPSSSAADATNDARNWKRILYEHHATPRGPSWPSGFTYRITWDSSSNPSRCKAFYDEPSDCPNWCVRDLARKWINGVGNADVPSGVCSAVQPCEILSFVDNATPRPGSFCGKSCSDHICSKDYNAEWSAYLVGLRNYLSTNSMLDKVYYYVQNEPQDQADFDLAAYLCALTRSVAPDLPIALSEEPKPQILTNALYACAGYDHWFVHFPSSLHRDWTWTNYMPARPNDRIWFYSLPQDTWPDWQPVPSDLDGVHTRIIGWSSWAERASGYTYYDFSAWWNSDTMEPTVTAEIMRDAVDDYEYLFIANGGAFPLPNVAAVPDPAAHSAAWSTTAWSRSPEALTALRHELGRFIEGTRVTVPVVTYVSPAARPRGAYYLNFGPATMGPVSWRGQTWEPYYWKPLDTGYNSTDSWGMYGSACCSSGRAMASQNGSPAAPTDNPVQSSNIYDDYGKKWNFDFALENGWYNVTVGIGESAPRNRPADPSNVVIEGVRAVKDWLETTNKWWLEVSVPVYLTDGMLTVAVGGRSDIVNLWEDDAYTFLQYLQVEPISAAWPLPSPTMPPTPSNAPPPFNGGGGGGGGGGSSSSANKPKQCSVAAALTFDNVDKSAFDYDSMVTAVADASGTAAAQIDSVTVVYDSKATPGATSAIVTVSFVPDASPVSCEALTTALIDAVTANSSPSAWQAVASFSAAPPSSATQTVPAKSGGGKSMSDGAIAAAVIVPLLVVGCLVVLAVVLLVGVVVAVVVARRATSGAAESAGVGHYPRKNLG